MDRANNRYINGFWANLLWDQYLENRSGTKYEEYLPSQS